MPYTRRNQLSFSWSLLLCADITPLHNKRQFSTFLCYEYGLVSLVLRTAVLRVSDLVFKSYLFKAVISLYVEVGVTYLISTNQQILENMYTIGFNKCSQRKVKKRLCAVVFTN